MRISDWSSDVCSSDLLVEDIELEDRADRELRVGMLRGEGGDGVVVERGDEKAGPARQRGEIGGDARETVVGHVEAGDAQAEHPIVGRGAEARKSVATGKRVSVRVDLGGSRHIKKKNN